jgi:hypothetical protein
MTNGKHKDETGNKIVMQKIFKRLTLFTGETNL